jgi:hypothetical protein
MSLNTIDLVAAINSSWPGVVERASKPHRQGKIYPSTLTLGCKLVCYLDLIFAEALPENRSADSIITMDEGEFLHQGIQKGLLAFYAKMGWFYAPEVRIKVSELCSARYDANVIDPHGEVEIHEYKSCSKGVFEIVERNAKEDHVDQVHIYMKTTGIHRGYLIYICRDNGKVRVHPVKYDPARGDQLITDILDLEQAARDKRPPPATIVQFGAQSCVRACVYRHLCPQAMAATNRRKFR